MGRPGADPQLVVGFDDAVEAGHMADVDKETRLGQPQLQ